MVLYSCVATFSCLKWISERERAYKVNKKRVLLVDLYIPECSWNLKSLIWFQQIYHSAEQQHRSWTCPGSAQSCLSSSAWSGTCPRSHACSTAPSHGKAAWPLLAGCLCSTTAVICSVFGINGADTVSCCTRWIESGKTSFCDAISGISCLSLSLWSAVSPALGCSHATSGFHPSPLVISPLN